MGRGPTQPARAGASWLAPRRTTLTCGPAAPGWRRARRVPASRAGPAQSSSSRRGCRRPRRPAAATSRWRWWAASAERRGGEDPRCDGARRRVICADRDQLGRRRAQHRGARPPTIVRSFRQLSSAVSSPSHSVPAAGSGAIDTGDRSSLRFVAWAVADSGGPMQDDEPFLCHVPNQDPGDT